jgi:ABC-type polysaccharide/polyol phosphate export permease
MTAYLREIWRSRYFWFALVRVDLRERYRGSVLGMGWSLLHPISMTIIFTTVFCRLFNEDPRAYGCYVLTGMACWTFLLNCTLQGCDSFFRAESYIRQHPAPIAIYPLRTVLAMMFHFLIALVLAAILATFLVKKVTLMGLLSLPLSIALLFLLGWALALLGGLANVYFRDTRHLAEVAFQILFYLTPVFYTAKVLGDGTLADLLRWNPILPFLDLFRAPLVDGMVPGPLNYAKALLIVMMASTLSMFALSRMERRLVFHL